MCRRTSTPSSARSAEESVAKLAKDSGFDSTRLTTVVRQGGIYHEVLEEAELMGADLIVMVSHRPALKTYFLGSNAGHVVRYAKCSVLVVRAKNRVRLRQDLSGQLVRRVNARPVAAKERIRSATGKSPA